jgi:radical SAM superfamily enzyme YgiQ (UPF0313 family)
MSSTGSTIPLLSEVRALAPGFAVCFSKPYLWSGGKPGPNRTRFPHVSGTGVGEATPELLRFAAALSAASGSTDTASTVSDRTVGEVIEAAVEPDEDKKRREKQRGRLRRFVIAVDDAGYLVADPPAPRWLDEPRLEADSEEIAAGPSARYEVPEGTNLLVDGGHFVWFDHGGALRLRLTPDEMIATRAFRAVRTPDEVWSELSEEAVVPEMSRASFDDLVHRLVRSGILRRIVADERRRDEFDPIEENAREHVLAGVLEAVAEYEQECAKRPGRRTAVVPVSDYHNMAPLGLGLLLAYAQELDGGRLKERYDFVPLFLAEEHTVLEWAKRSGIFLFSNYIWNYERNLQLSALVKQANPANITIHGGPSTPKYEGDCEEYFRINPHVDITVRGEGEATFAAILDALDPDYVADLSKLHDVEGLSYRDGDTVVHTPDRERIQDLDSIPSPYLLGLFEPFGRAHIAAVLESNRGCPYGCTFCDWGSATLSRIRKFDMERVKAELEWFSKNELIFVSLCDANFGILERDVEIAAYIAEMKKKYGYPKTAALNYAKNTMKHLRPIIETFANVGLNIEPTVAVQTMDETTLKIIRRSNIKTEKYDELAEQFRRSGLKLATDVMMGLPGSTVASFKTDLQKCTDRDIRVRCNPTVLLPNSPMNDPAYRAEHGIVARPHEIIKEAKSFTREDFEEMERLRTAFYVFDSFGVLRHIALFVRSEVGVKEVDFYDRITRDALAAPLQWPIIASQVRMMEVNLAPPSSWGLFVEEVGRYAVERLGVEPGTALDTALAAQLAHLPAADRTMPQTVHLQHDYAAWYAAVFEARSGERRNEWERDAPRLRDYPPGELKVSDPHDVCGTLVGKQRQVLAWNIQGWDMSSPVARAT